MRTLSKIARKENNVESSSKFVEKILSERDNLYHQISEIPLRKLMKTFADPLLGYLHWHLNLHELGDLVLNFDMEEENNVQKSMFNSLFGDFFSKRKVGNYNLKYRLKNEKLKLKFSNTPLLRFSFSLIR